MDYTLYALPAAAALLAKIGIFYYARRTAVQNAQTRVYLLFLLCLAIMDLTEIELFLSNAGSLSNPPSFIGTLYFSASTAAIALLLHLALLIARAPDGDPDRGLAPATLGTIYAPGMVLQLLLWGTASVVAGFEPTGYTYSKVPGPLYPLFQGYAISYLFAAPVLLYHGYRSQSTPFRRLQNKLFLLGLLPIPLVVVSVIVLQQAGFRAINSTATVPLAVTFFLVVTAYATHQYRLFEIEFFIPWSKVRRRKTAFYQRIQATIGAIAELRSARQIIRLLADTLNCDVALVGGPRPVSAGTGEGAATAVARFPRSALASVGQITIAQEIAGRDPSLHRLMRQHRVAAIVPFASREGESTQWLVLGDHFSNNVYSPLDFKVVERLFSAIAERFLDDFLRVRSELKEAEQRLRETRRRLGLAWHKEHELKNELRTLRDQNDNLRRQLAELQSGVARTFGDGESEQPRDERLTLGEYLSECERQRVASALDRCQGSRRAAARLLGISRRALERLIRRHGLGITPDHRH